AHSRQWKKRKKPSAPTIPLCILNPRQWQPVNDSSLYTKSSISRWEIEEVILPTWAMFCQNCVRWQNGSITAAYGVNGGIREKREGKWSERQDSNLRRLAPKASALARLSYAPTTGRHNCTCFF